MNKVCRGLVLVALPFAACSPSSEEAVPRDSNDLAVKAVVDHLADQLTLADRDLLPVVPESPIGSYGFSRGGVLGGAERREFGLDLERFLRDVLVDHLSAAAAPDAHEKRCMSRLVLRPRQHHPTRRDMAGYQRLPRWTASGDSIVFESCFGGGTMRYEDHLQIGRSGSQLRRATRRGTELRAVLDGGINFVIDALPLLAGGYTVIVALLKINAIHPYEFRRGAGSFRVRHGTKELGVTRLPHRWERL